MSKSARYYIDATLAAAVLAGFFLSAYLPSIRERQLDILRAGRYSFTLRSLNQSLSLGNYPSTGQIIDAMKETQPYLLA
jgi:hypothetical protein